MTQQIHEISQDIKELLKISQANNQAINDPVYGLEAQYNENKKQASQISDLEGKVKDLEEDVTPIRHAKKHWWKYFGLTIGGSVTGGVAFGDKLLALVKNLLHGN